MADRDGKRKHTGGDRTGAVKKKHWTDPTKVQGIPVGSRGVLVSCVTGKESHAGREAVAVLSVALEALCPEAAAQASGVAGGEAPAADAPSDISALLADELAELKDRSKQPFTWRMMGIGSLVFVQVNYAQEEGPSPAELVLHACHKARDTKQNTTRLCMRFYPVEYTCAANISEISVLAKRVAAKHFPADAAEGCTFSVEYDRRAAPPALDRMETINAFANAVPQPPHKVNLSAPQRSILVNVVKGSCGVSVVDEYKSLAKFNIAALALAEEEEEGKGKKAADKAPAAAETATVAAGGDGATEGAAAEPATEAAAAAEPATEEP